MRKLLALLTALSLLSFPLNAYAETDTTASAPAVKNAPLQLLGQLYANQNMMVYSPLSLSLALSMAEEGAQGSTKDQLSAVLGDNRPGAMELEDLAFSGVKIANTAFLRSDFTLLADYEETLSDSYDAEPMLMIDGNVMNQVNDWVFEHTDGLIDGLLTEEPDGNTKLLLINALSLKADWVHSFNPVNTLAGLFHAPEGDIEVSMMHQSDIFLYGETEGVQTVVLPYRNSSLEMLVLMPGNGNLQPLVDELSASPDAFIEKHAPTENAMVSLALPNVRAESSFELKDALIALGASDAFNPDKADFTAMAENADELDLYIGSVLQKAVLNVNETGTEAAAATQVAMLARGAYMEKIVEMTVDRPFILLLRDSTSRFVLFAACINNPA